MGVLSPSLSPNPEKVKQVFDVSLEVCMTFSRLILSTLNLK